jgi:hypothetical protein
MPVTNEWVPVVNAAVVGLLAILGIVVSQIWTSRRDRNAKLLEIEDRRQNQRMDFQRKTLLRLQVALRKFARAEGVAWHHTEMEHRKTGNWGVRLPDEMNQDTYDTLSRVLLLSNRVIDDELRGLIDRLTHSAFESMMTRTKDAAEPHWDRFHEELDEANDRLGKLLRELL